MNEKEFSKGLVIKNITIPNASYIVNGKPQIMETTCICCPNCDKPIINFNQRYEFIEVQKYINENYEALSTEIHYCVNCGQKIHFNKIIDI